PILRKFWIVFRPFFTEANPNRRSSWGWLVFMLFLLGLESAFLVSFSYLQRDFSTAMSEKDEAGFYRGVRRYVLILLLAAPLFALSDFVQGKLRLDWRCWLTDRLCGLYFSNRSFYTLKTGVHGAGTVTTVKTVGTVMGQGATSRENQGGDIDNPISTVDNPDQRIGEDTAAFTQNCITVIVVFVGRILNVCSFVGVLLAISPQLTSFVVLYSVGGTLVTTALFGLRLKHINFEGAKKEANFRFGLVRVREHAEEIAFYRGEGREASAIAELFNQVCGLCVYVCVRV
ncbi:unnamed protein product, partial [Choristocarpus tenellus]